MSGYGELKRTRLLDVIVPQFQPGMILVLTGGPGTGKTVFLRQLQTLRGDRTACIDLAGFSADSTALVRQIENTILQLWPELASSWQQYLQPEPGFQDVLEHFGFLLDELVLSGEVPATIAFDCCEVLADRPQWLEFFSLFVSRLPAFVSLIFSSRCPLRIPVLPTLRLQGRLLELGAEELHFDEEEIFCFLSSRFTTISRRETALVYEKVGGWPAGITLLALEMEKKGPALLDKSSTACLHEYMQCAVFSDLPAAARRILCSLSLVQPFDNQIISALFDQQQVAGVLASYAFFFTPPTKKDDERQFAHLYADFFQGQAPVVLGKEGVRNLHQCAATFFRKQGANNRALVHLIALQAWREAVELLLTTYQHWFEGEDYSQLPYWVEQLPCDTIQHTPRLGVLLGQAHMYLGNLDTAGQCVQQAHASSRPGSKTWLESGCLLCEIMLLQGKRTAEVELADELISQARFISQYRVRAMMFKAIGLHLLCRFQESDRLWQKISTIAHSRFIPLNKASRCYIMAPKAVFHNLERGEFEESGRILDEAIAVFRHQDPMKRLGWALLFKAICKVEKHQYNEALTWMREAENVSSRTNRSVHATCIAFLSLVLALVDQREEAGQWLERAEPLASRDLSMWAPIICCLARAHLGRTREDVLADLQLAWNLASQRVMLLPLTLTACVAHRLRERIPGSAIAEDYCRQAAEKCHHWNVAHREACLRLYLSIQQRHSAPEQADRDFCRAMTLISENRHGFLLTGDTCMDGLSLVLQAVRRNIGREYFLQLAPFWGKHAFAGLKEIFARGRLELKIKIIEIWAKNGYRPALQLIDQSLKTVRGKDTRERLKTLREQLCRLPPEPVHIHLFGRFTIIRGEDELSESAWKRHKARDLFKYLCLHPQTVFTREQLTDLFWPDLNPEKAKSRLWGAISTIRAALEPELPARAKSAYLRCTSQTYALALPEGSTIDTIEFSRNIKEGHRFRKDGDKARALLCFETAIQAYKGGLLPGDRYASWCAEPQEHYQRLLTDALRATASIYMEQRDFDAAVRTYRQIIALNSWDEDAYLELMRCHVLQGRELKAVEIYRHCEKMLDREFGVTPAQKLQEFVRRILRRRQQALPSSIDDLSEVTG